MRVVCIIYLFLFYINDVSTQEIMLLHIFSEIYMPLLPTINGYIERALTFSDSVNVLLSGTNSDGSGSSPLVFCLPFIGIRLLNLVACGRKVTTTVSSLVRVCWCRFITLYLNKSDNSSSIGH